MSFPRYQKYKASGVDQLREIPSHWITADCRRAIDLIEQGWSPVAEDRLAELNEWAVIKLGAVSNGKFIPEEHKALPIDLPPDTRYEIREGDLLLTRANTPELVGSVCVAHGVRPKLMLSDLVYRLRLRESMARPTFFAYWLLSKFGRYQIVSDAHGTSQSMVKVSQGHIRAWVFVVPPLEEQDGIALFLDRETAKIDALVAEQERLIELLKEKRQAVISHAVTKGLNPQAAMKPSGIEWLGEVPAHWGIGPLKRYWSVTDCKHVTPEFVDDGIPLASIREVQGRWVSLENAKCTTEHFYEALIEGGRLPIPGDLIFSRNATVGEVAQVRVDHPRFAMGQDVVLIRGVVPECSPDYLQYVIRSPIAVEQLSNLMIGSTFKRINVEEIRSLVVPSPPQNEQRAIALFLDSEVDRFDTLTGEAQHAIDLLQERRSALISAAVTGQIDVRSLGEKQSA